MSVFNVITLLGGLAMFLYGMRLMGNSIKESSSGALKQVMERVTNNPIKALILGICVTAIIQSSTATIVITSGLVAAGVLSLRQSLGILVGANIGTTVTGQVIRLLDINASASSWLQFFKPSTLAPLALIFGILLIMGFRFKKSDMIGNICIGFGILFSGLLNMTESVSALSDTGIFDNLFANLGENPLIGYATGAGIAFVLQSSSATIGILQAFSMTGQLPFKSVYAVVVGIYLGDCVTTAIVCSIGAKPDAKRVGAVNIIFNLCETVVVLTAVTILHKLGVLDALWDKPLNSGGIANMNTIFNFGCAILLFPLLNTYEKISRKIIKDEKKPVKKYADKLEALNPAFFSTPALAFQSCYSLLLTMESAARVNIDKAFQLVFKYDDRTYDEIMAEEDNIDELADYASNYLVELSAHIKENDHLRIMGQYYKMISEFEGMGDRAVDIADAARRLSDKNASLSKPAQKELTVLRELTWNIIDYAEQAFEKRDVKAAGHIEPLEIVASDMVNTLRENHIDRLQRGVCTVDVESDYLNILANIERVAGECSNIGVATITRANPELATVSHGYLSALHQGDNEDFNAEYDSAHDRFFTLLEAATEAANA